MSKKRKRRHEVMVGGERMYRSRHVMEQHLGRKLLSDEWVHHINGDVTDDRIENLQIMTPKEHGKLLWKGGSKASARRYHQKHRKKILENKRKQYQKNKEKGREYYQKNKEKISEYRRKRYQKNREAELVRMREYYQKNKEKILESQRKRYQKKRRCKNG